MKHRSIFHGVDILSRAIAHLREQFRIDMPSDAARAHFDARCLLINLQASLLDDLEAEHGLKKRNQSCPS